MSLTLHKIAAVGHLIQASYTAYISASSDNEIILPVKFKNTLLWEYKLSPLIASFAGLSAVNHIFTALNPEQYKIHILHGNNPWRWTEYSLSATLMMIVIAQLSAVYDLDALVVISILTPLLMYIGHLTEQYTDPKLAKILFVIGCVILLSIWIFPASSFIDAIQSSTRNPPNVVYVIVVLMFILFSSFGVVNFLHINNRDNAQSIFSNFMTIETLYIILSLVSKSLLTNLTISGAIFRDQDTVVMST